MAIERIEPAPGQESVWDYPRPPKIVPSRRRVEVEFGGVTVVDSRRALRVLETSQAPAYYVPFDDVRADLLEAVDGHHTVCEWKGRASYYDVRVGARVAERAAWTYPRPATGYEPLAGHVAFYPSRVDACRVDGELVRPMPGDFYGGWITEDVVGPFKGARGTEHW